MKLLMLVRNDREDPRNIGFFKKFSAQLKTFQKEYQIDSWFLYSKGGTLMLEEIKTGVAYQEKVFFSSWTKNLFFYHEAWKSIKKISPDVIYIRYKISEPLFLYFLRKLRQEHIKIILEFPTFPYDQNWKVESRIKRAVLPMDRFFRKKLHKYVSLALNCSKESQIYGLKTLAIQNGFQVDNQKVGKRPDTASGFHFTGVAVLGFWHGYDRMIRGLWQYYQNERHPVYLHIVGHGPVLKDIKNMVSRWELEKCVFFHGILYEAELEEIYAQTHMAVGTLGWHRMGVFESSTLKNREYCAKGIPFIFAGEDPDFPLSFPYALRVPENEEPVDIKTALAFYHGLDQSKLGVQMLNHAQTQLSWKKKMAPVAKWIKEHSYSGEG